MKSLRQVKSKSGKVTLAIFIILAIGFGFLIGYLSKPTTRNVETKSYLERALVSHVIDGDTIEIEDGRRIRYLGIDTPELGEPYSDEASAKNREFVEGKIVELQEGNRDVDEYDRLLRYVYVDGIFVNAELVAQGYAVAYIFDPNERYSQVLVQLEQYAKMNRKGLWNVSME